MLWEWNRTLERIHEALYIVAREAADKEASSSVAIIDSQSAKAAQKGARQSIRRGSTRVRKSSAGSDTSLSTRSVSC
jgi:hypothetical protein